MAGEVTGRVHTTREFSIPPNQKSKKYNLSVVIIVAVLGILVTALTSIIWYVVSGFGCALLGHVLMYYQDDYCWPSKATVSDSGIRLEYRRKRPRFIPWHRVQRLSISKRPGFTVSDAALKPAIGNWIPLSLEAGLYIADMYREIYGRPVPGRDGR